MGEDEGGGGVWGGWWWGGGGGCGFFFFFKQKTAYEIGTGDWSSDVCSSDLRRAKLNVLRCCYVRRED